MIRFVALLLLHLLVCCRSSRNEDEKNIKDFVSCMKTYHVDTMRKAIDTMFYSQKFFNKKMLNRDLDDYGFHLLMLSETQPLIAAADSFLVEDVDLESHRVHLDRGDHAYKAIFFEKGLRTDSMYFLFNSGGIESFMAIRKGEFIATWM